MKKLISVVLCAFILTTHSFAAPLGSTTITSDGAYIMDFASGKALYEYNANVEFVPASITKLVSLYLIYEDMANGKFTLTDKVKISEKSYNLSRDWDNGGGAVPLYYNEVYTVNEMLDAVIVNSLNAGILALAELSEGSEAQFVKRMNEKVNEWNITAYFEDCIGLSSRNKMTPYAVAKCAQNIIRDYPEILTRSSKKSVNFHGKTLKATNKLLSTHYYEGVDGLKSGTTSAALFCFCGTAKRNGDRIITVTMRSDSDDLRYTDSKKLLDYGFGKLNFVFSTNIKTIINGFEVPTFMYNGADNFAVVIAEDLACYGFDVSYDGESRTIYIERNENKAENPIAMDYYNSLGIGTKFFKINKKSDLKVKVLTENGEAEMLNVLDFNGYAGVSADELAHLFGGFWNAEDMAVVIE